MSGGGGGGGGGTPHPFVFLSANEGIKWICGSALTKEYGIYWRTRKDRYDITALQTVLHLKKSF